MLSIVTARVARQNEHYNYVAAKGEKHLVRHEEGESASDILADLQPDPEVRMFIDSSALLCACRHHFEELISMLSKLPKDKALPLYQNAAHIFGAFSKDCQNKANEIEQQ